jgi:hypothetical protein
MPLIFIAAGLRFAFYSNDHEPIHAHVTKGQGAPKEKQYFAYIQKYSWLQA